MVTVRPYESEAVRAVTGQTIRPGALELTRRAADYCGLGQGDRLLDVGCGTGASMEFLRTRYGVMVAGMDLSRNLLATARRQQPPLNLIRGDAMALPLKAGRLRAITCECVCSLLPDAASALAAFHRILQPKGHLIISDLYWRMNDETVLDLSQGAGGCLTGAVDRQTMVNRIESAGFQIELWEDHTQLLKSLAAQLVWAGVSLDAWWGVDCTSGGCSGRQRPGYCLIIARKLS